MANVDRPMGFRPVKSLIGAPWTALVREYTAGDRSADTTNNHGDIYIGDPVALNASGQVIVANSGDTVLGVAVATGKAVNSFGETGYFNSDDLTKRYLAYNEDGIVGVVPAEACLFQIQSATDLDLVMGDEADMNSAAATAHGNRVTGNSSVELVADTNSDVRVVEVVRSPDNDLTLVNAGYIVQFVTTTNTL